MDDEMGHSDMEQASLQMLTHDNCPAIPMVRLNV